MKRYIFVLLIVFVGATACFSLKTSVEREIIGKWVNSGGGEIYFYENGTGYVPGIQGQEIGNISSLQFTYAFKDETHLVINMTTLPQANQQDIVIEVEIKNDIMTWHSDAGEIEFEYRRAN